MNTENFLKNTMFESRIVLPGAIMKNNIAYCIFIYHVNIKYMYKYTLQHPIQPNKL